MGKLTYSPFMVALIKTGILSMPNMDKGTKTMAARAAGLQKVKAEAGVVAGVVVEVKKDIEVVNENHALSLQQEGEH